MKKHLFGRSHVHNSPLTMAGGDKLMKEITDQFLQCKICFNAFTNPKTLTCLHTFCCECLQRHVDSESSRSRYASLYARSVSCPLCRKRTDIPTGGIRRLPDNFLLCNLTEIIDRRRPSKVPPCDICHQLRPNDACAKCLDCAKLLCKSCVAMHNDTKVTKNHSLIDVEGEKDIECKVHPEEMVRFYCDPCDTCICVVCTFQEHRDHEICDFSEGYVKYKQAMEKLLAESRTRIEHIHERLATINRCESSLKHTRENIRDLAISYIQQVRATERDLLKSLDDHYGDDVIDFLRNRDWLQENAEELENACNLTEIVMRDRGVELLLLKKEIKEKLEALMKPSIPALPQDMALDIHFSPGNINLGTLSSESGDDHNDVFSDAKADDRDRDLKAGKRTSANSGSQTEVNGVTCHGSSTDLERLQRHNASLEKDHAPQSLLTRSVSTVDVGQNTHRVTMVHRGSQVITNPGTPAAGLCNQCCQALSDPALGQAPSVEDIIIYDTTGPDAKEWRRRKRAMIRSRRIQTDVSLPLTTEVRDERKFLTFPYLNQRRELSESTETLSSGTISTSSRPDVTSVGLDPIVFDEEQVKRRRTRDKITMTTFDTKTKVSTQDCATNCDVIQTIEMATNTKIDTVTLETQTKCAVASKAVLTDPKQLSNKATSTPFVKKIDSETSMPVRAQVDNLTMTEPPSLSEHAVCTENCETSEAATETVGPLTCEQGLQAKPLMTNSHTGPMPVCQRDEGVQVYLEDKDIMADGKDGSNRKSWHGGGGIFSKLFKGSKSSSASNSEQDLVSSVRESHVITQDGSTETDILSCSDKETSTLRLTTSDQWTETPSPVMVNTGISPRRPATLEIGVETNHVVTMDQATYTELKQYKDCETETVLVVQDNETLTDRVKMMDAQTHVDIAQETEETNTDTLYVTDAMVTTATSNMVTKTISTDTEGLPAGGHRGSETLMDSQTRATKEQGTMAMSTGQHHAHLVNSMTQTSAVGRSDKGTAVGPDLLPLNGQRPRVETREISTATDSMPYINVLSHMDGGDELFLIPESAFDLVSNDDLRVGGDHQVEMIDDETTTETVASRDVSAQTVISSAWINDDIGEDELALLIKKELNGKVLFDMGTNTVPKLTFEKESGTPTRHQFSKGTMTCGIAKQDKATSTFSHTRHIAETCFGNRPPCHKSNKDTMATPDTRDASTLTDYNLMDEKMAACISKLRNVSEKLQSPTTKSAPEVPWGSPNDSFELIEKFQHRPSSADDIRRQNVLDLVAQTQTFVKPRESRKDTAGRKAQPITTLKGKLALPEVEQKSRSLPREYPDGKESPNRERESPSRISRFHSAPGRIATVPNHPGLKMKSNTSAKAKKPKLKDEDQSKMQNPPRIILSSIEESRTKSTCSESDSSTSYMSASSEPPSDILLDLDALKIPVPSQRKASTRAVVLEEEEETNTPEASSNTPKASSNTPKASSNTPEASSNTPKASSNTPEASSNTPEASSNTPEASSNTHEASSNTPEASSNTPEESLNTTVVAHNEDNVGFMQKLFSKNSKKKKSPSKPTSSSSSQPTGMPATTKKASKPSPAMAPKAGPSSPSPVPKQTPTGVKPKTLSKPKTEEVTPKSPKPQRSRPFVYMRQRIFSIQHDGEESPSSSSTKVKATAQRKVTDKPSSKTSSKASTSKQKDRPPSEYDNI